MGAVRRKAFPHLESFVTDTPVIDRALQRIRDLLNPLLINPLNNSVILENVALVVGTNKIAHGLGRKARMFFVMATTAGGTGDVYSLQADNPDQDRTIWVGLQTSNTTATILVA